MQAVLITLGILGFGAVLISIYVFTVAARRYVHERVERPHPAPASAAKPEKLYITRSGRDRREESLVDFPLKLPNGEIILADRRRGDERRAVA